MSKNFSSKNSDKYFNPAKILEINFKENYFLHNLRLEICDLN